MTEIIVAIIAFALIVLVLSLLVLAARHALVPSGNFTVLVNDSRTVTVPAGQRLLYALNNIDINLPSACGGAGTCGLCKVRIVEGGTEPTPQDLTLLTRLETRKGVRLACQVPVVSEMEVEVDDIYFGVQTWQCTVESTHNVSSLIKEIVLRLPEGEKLQLRAGGFVQITCPAYQLSFKDIRIDSDYKENWSALNLDSLTAGTDTPVTRAYSVANPPGQDDRVTLNIRIALPPPTSGVPPGIVSSWLFALKPGDTVQASGPYGHFYVEPGDSEAIFVGGGVGMAPLYAQILDLLEQRRTTRKISYWYGARSKRELYYDDVFNALQETNANFSWHVVLSEPEDSDKWDGPTGFVHTAIHDLYLKNHPEPENCEYFLCGPPMMIKALRAMLDGLGVDPVNIHYDDFGGGG